MSWLLPLGFYLWEFIHHLMLGHVRHFDMLCYFNTFFISSLYVRAESMGPGGLNSNLYYDNSLQVKTNRIEFWIQRKMKPFHPSTPRSSSPFSWLLSSSPPPHHLVQSCFFMVHFRFIVFFAVPIWFYLLFKSINMKF